VLDSWGCLSWIKVALWESKATGALPEELDLRPADLSASESVSTRLVPNAWSPSYFSTVLDSPVAFLT